MSRIYLASRSPRRRELLRQIGIAFEIVLLREDVKRTLDVDETPLPGETAQDYALRIAGRKAERAAHFLGKRTLPMLPVRSLWLQGGRLGETESWMQQRMEQLLREQLRAGAR